MLGCLVSQLAAQHDPDMVWEGRVAVGFAALVYVGPLWLVAARSSVPHRLRPRWPGGRCASSAAVLKVPICI